MGGKGVAVTSQNGNSRYLAMRGVFAIMFDVTTESVYLTVDDSGHLYELTKTQIR